MKKIDKVPGRWGKQNRPKSFKDKKMQSELLKNFEDDEHRWLQCSTVPRKVQLFFILLEEMV